MKILIRGPFVSNPKILKGTPVIEGTRVPVSRILFLTSEGLDVNEIGEEYPQFSSREIAFFLRCLAENFDAAPIQK